jgi:hypothetical protein
MIISHLWSFSDREVSALRISEKITIDGKLTESAWKKAPMATGFVQNEPTPGTDPTFQTQSHILYDDEALYIGAFMHDNDPSKILKELSIRDEIGNADNFRFFLDPYRSGLNGFLFFVTASGVQYEGIVSNHEDDENWNCIWESEVFIAEDGWYVEMRIPYSSLRFPEIDVQSWGMQIGREIRRLREVSYWSPIDPNIDGWVQQSGVLSGISNIKTPIRLSLIPYATAYLKNISQSELNPSTAYTAGLDLKYGINDAYTLDMTLIPDFGQVISDKQILNLSPFEVYFEENRPFFTEGTELFDKGSLFYSRRVGGVPLKYYNVFQEAKDETIINNPGTTQLYNALKLTGRNSKGLGTGLFNAIVGETYATLRNNGTNETRKVLTNPLTIYNSFVIDKNLKNNSFVSFINNNVMRRGEFADANVTGIFTSLRSKDQNYAVNANAVMSHRFQPNNTESGFSYNLEAGRISGKWTYALEHGIESANYNPNDLGFLYSSNEVYYRVAGTYTNYKPQNEKLQQIRHNLSVGYNQLYAPWVYQDIAINYNSFKMFKSRFAYGLFVTILPTPQHDYFEPRWLDYRQFLRVPENFTIGGFISSDYRKPFAYDVRMNYQLFNEAGRKTWATTFSPRWRINDQISIIFTNTIENYHKDQGYVGILEDLPSGNIYSLIGTRNRTVVENTISAKYSINSKINFNMRVRHYWHNVNYVSAGFITTGGYLEEVPNNFNDLNYNLYNLDLQFNWRFAPGSDIAFVWKNEIDGINTVSKTNYFESLKYLSNLPNENEISLRILYYIDYNSFNL